MKAPRLVAAPPALVAKSEARAIGAMPLSEGAPLRSTEGAPSRFDNLLLATAPRQVATGRPDPQRLVPDERAGRPTADAAVERLVDGFANEFGVERPLSVTAKGKRGEPPAPGLVAPSVAPAAIAGRASEAARAAPMSEAAPEVSLDEGGDARARELQLMASLAAFGSGPSSTSSRPPAREKPLTAERPLAHALQTLRAKADEAPQLLTEPQSQPLEVRTSRLAATVTRIETHFAPVHPPAVSPGERRSENGRVDTAGLFDQIRRVLDGSGERAASDQRVMASPQQTSATLPTAMRVLEIALHPASLGSLAVTFRLSGTGTMKVTISATERDTAAALGEDADELASIIAAAGYEVDDITVTFFARP